MNGRAVLYVVGLLTAFAGLAMLVPAAVSFAMREQEAPRILLSAAITIVAGIGLMKGLGRRSEISIRDGFAIVTLAWIAIAAVGSLPYLLTGAVPNVSRAFFESMSGLTTTGATIVTDIGALPRGLVLWRSMTQWLGGMGIIVLSVAILPLLGVGGMQLLQAEIPGLTPDRLTPRVRHTAALLWVVYAALTLTEIVLLVLGGMTHFEAVNHALTTMATGGFSTEDGSIGAFDSAYLQYVVAIFIVLAGVNFTLHYSWMKGRWKTVFRNEELRVYLALIAIATLALTLLVYLPGTIPGVEASFRAGFFQVASIMTTTGFATHDYETWIAPAQILIFLLMLVGGSTGSTSGSIKVFRYVLIMKEARTSLRRLLHPQGVFVYKLDGRPVSQDVLATITGFFLLYLAALGAGTFVLAAFGLDVPTALGSAVATIGNIGPGFGAVGPAETYATLPVAALWVLSFLMLLGRLELYTVLILLTRGFWR